MKKHTKIFVWCCSGIILFVLIIIAVIVILAKNGTFRNQNSFCSKISRKINGNENPFKVVCKNCDSSHLKIIWKCEREEPNEAIIYDKGIKASEIENEYGKNKFLIYYDDQLLFQAGHFKFANWHTHDYLFCIEKRANAFWLYSRIDGPDEITDINFYPRHFINK